MRRVLEEYESSGQTRREFCEGRGIAFTTFDYWRRIAVKPGKQARRPRWWRSKWRRGSGAAVHVESGQWAADRLLVAVRRGRTGAADPCRRKRVMFGLGLATKIYIATEAIDMRKGFEGLHGLVRDRLGARSVERTFVLVHQSHAHPTESAGVGWQRIVGVREAARERPVSLARSGPDENSSV